MKSKVPDVVFAFWLIKICATTLGETAGDAVSMTLKVGYAASTGIFFALFLAAVASQIASRSYHPFLYWATVVATTTVGTTMSDYLTRSEGLGYTRASILLFVLVMVTLAVWHFVTGSVSVSRITAPKTEAFYWTTILFSNTLGTALGDFLADTSGLGFEGGAFVFGSALALIAVAYFVTNLSRAALFWSAFILTRPLGATLGDLLTKPHESGGFDLNRITASLAIAAFMVSAILLASKKPQQPAEIG
jgi:uncharacterized membrane-anchored protein